MVVEIAEWFKETHSSSIRVNLRIKDGILRKN